MKRYALPLALMLVLLTAVVCAEPVYPTRDFSGQTAFPVLRIVDGDTVLLAMDGKAVRVRLIGVDTPETVHPNKAVEAYGKEASQFLSNLLKGEKVYVEDKPDEKTDKYGRSLFYLYRAPDGLFVNLEIVRQGYGHAYTRFPFEHMELFREYEKQARIAGRGLWGTETAATTPPAQPRTEKVVVPVIPVVPVAPAKRETTVYITRTGKKYHRAGCRYLSKSQIPISLEDAKRRGYTPCSGCKP